VNDETAVPEMQSAELLAAIDRKLRSKRLSAKTLLKLEARRSKVLRKLHLEQSTQVPQQDDGLKECQRIALSRFEGREKEIWEAVYRIENEADAAGRARYAASK
jgi:hypothetical protein